MTNLRSTTLGLAAVVAVAACTATPPVQLDASGGTGDKGVTVGSLPPVSPPSRAVTVTETVTVTVTPTGTAGPRPSATALPTTPSIPAAFDVGAARRAAQAVLADVRHLDRDFAGSSSPSTGPRPTTSGRTSTPSPGHPAGGAAAQDLRSLGAHLGDLLAAGVPTGTDGPSYVARILSLQTFVSAAIEETRTNPLRAAARYGVIRPETAVLLTQVEAGTGDTLTLPPSAPAR